MGWLIIDKDSANLFGLKSIEMRRTGALNWAMAGKSTMAEFSGLLEVGGLPDLGPGPRSGVLSHDELTKKLDPLLHDSELPSVRRDLVRGLVLLWHDRMEPAHEIAQGIENADGSFLHGILHRREPDYGNATYWFRRAGSQSCFAKIAERTAAFLTQKDRPDLQAKLIAHGEWDPFAFIGLCEKAASRSSDAGLIILLREIQGIESRSLLEYWLNS
jgi:hypothetical protein